MKKLFVFLLIGFFAAFLTFTSVNADEEPEYIELYPYNDPNTLTASEPMVPGATRVGDSYWRFIFNGHRYYVARGGARFVKDFSDANANGTIEALEMTQLSWNAFASVIINDTDESVELATASARADLTAVVHRIYAYFDEAGEFSMFEDQIHTYYITNDGAGAEPDWRLSTESEIADYIADQALETPTITADQMRLAHIRMALDENDANGYVLEPLVYIQWVNPDIPETEAIRSTIVTHNPDNVLIPAGWTVVSFGTNDRSESWNMACVQYIKGLPYAMNNEAVAPFEVYYDTQSPVFAGIASLDDDVATPGVNIVVEYQGTFDLPTNVSTSWIKMFDENGKIINVQEKLDYKVEISRDDVVLQTINFTYNQETNTYSKDASVTVIDSSEFGAGYTATWVAVNPLGGETRSSADIVIGVMPPRFEGVTNRFVDEYQYVDLMEGITADDGYGNDLTSTVVVSKPADLNVYYPKAGSYRIELEFTHHIFIPGQEFSLTIKGNKVPFDPTLAFNKDINISTYIRYAVFTEVTHLRDSGTAWGSMIVIVGADGKVKESYSRYDWLHISPDNPAGITGSLEDFTAWQAAITLAPGEFAVTAHGSTDNVGPTLRALAYGDSVELVIGTEDFNYDIVTKASYTLTVDDRTAPELIVINDNYRIEADQFETVEAAILANVVATDNSDSRQDIAIYVQSKGGMNTLTPGTYTVIVGADDTSGNSSTVTFTVTVVPAKPTQQEVDDKVDEVQEIADGKLTQEQIQELIDNAVGNIEDKKGVSLGMAIVFSVATGLLSFGGAVLFFMKKK